MVDPVSLAITVAVTAASMALTAAQTFEGPRLNDLSVTTADYGTPIPYVEGRRRVEPPVFYAERLKEKKKKTKTKSGKYKEYFYFGTWALLIAGNPMADLWNVWLDRHLAWSRTDTAEQGLVDLVLGENMRFYRGEEDQLPDQRMVATTIKEEDGTEGYNLTPAYRGTSYLMFEEVALEPFGNRLPQCSVEASSLPQGTGEDNFEWEELSDFVNYVDTDYYSPGYANYPSLLSPNGRYGIGTDFYDTSYLVDYIGKELVWKRLLSDMSYSYGGYDFYGFKPFAVDDEGSAWGNNGDGVFSELGPEDAVPQGRGAWLDDDPPDGFADGYRIRLLFTFTMPDDSIRIIFFPGVSGQGLGRTYFSYVKGVGPLQQHSVADFQPNWAFQDDLGDIWLQGEDLVVGGPRSDTFLLRISDVTGSSPYVEGRHVTDLPSVDTTLGIPEYLNVVKTQCFFFQGRAVGGIIGTPINYFAARYLVSIDLSTAEGDTVVRDLTPYFYEMPYAQINANQELFYLTPYWIDVGDIYGAEDVRYQNEMHGFNASDLAEFNRFPYGLWEAPNYGEGYVHNPALNAFITQVTVEAEDFESATGYLNILYLPETLTITVGSVCTRLALAAGMAETDFDFSDLDQPVYGYSWTQGPAGQIAGPLLELHDSFIRPNGFIQEGVKRGKPLAGPTLTYDWMVRQVGAEDSAGEPLYKITSLSESELPQRIFVTFSDVTAEQQQNTAVSQRHGSSVWTKREISVDITPYALYPNDIQPLVERYLRRKWIGAVGVEATFTPRDMALLPGDVRNIGFEDDTIIRSFCTRTTIKANRAIETSWERDGPVPINQVSWENDTGSTISNLPVSPGGVSVGRPPPGMFSPVGTEWWILDIPLLDDADERSSPFAYFGASPIMGPDADWSGAVFVASDTGVEDSFDIAWDTVLSSDRGTYGSAYTALPDVGISSVIDDGTELVVDIVEGTLESATEAELLADRTLNLALVGDELIQFREAVLQSAGAYTLTGLVRGCRGTERHMGTHVIGERFILCDASLGIHVMGATELGDTDYYKVATLGREIDLAVAEAVPFTGEANRPLSPVNVTLVRDSGSGDWSIDATRRTRIGGSSLNGQDVPLGETAEAYRVKILDGPDVVRTLNVTSLPTLYVAADQTTDWGSPQTSLSVSVCQMSPSLSLEGHESLASA